MTIKIFSKQAKVVAALAISGLAITTGFYLFSGVQTARADVTCTNSSTGTNYTCYESTCTSSCDLTGTGASSFCGNGFTPGTPVYIGSGTCSIQENCNGGCVAYGNSMLGADCGQGSGNSCACKGDSTFSCSTDEPYFYCSYRTYEYDCDSSCNCGTSSGPTPTPVDTPTPTPAGPTPTPSASPYQSSCVGISAPSTVTPGQVFSASVTMQNNGGDTWSSASNYKLGAQDPQDNKNWGFNRVALPSSVSPGSQVTFNFNPTAPTTPGTYNFDWQMLQESVTWFGGTCTQSITVAAAPTPTPTPTPTASAPTLNLTVGVHPQGGSGSDSASNGGSVYTYAYGDTPTLTWSAG
ncbi:MAG: NBR1-Ig-like domain-containing protein, partial [Candidatus Doudnabacteria bacterium]|nr:NBR1-Ig-like domain-containing protein [Candidatus Doudnabacteria bacterium]